MTQRLLELENKYEELSLRLSEPNAASDPKSFSALMKEHSNLMPIVEKFRELKAAEKSVSEALELLDPKLQNTTSFSDNFQYFTTEMLKTQVQKVGKMLGRFLAKTVI